MTGKINYSPDYKSEPQSCQTPIDDLRRMALDHYDKVSSAAHEWHSAIPKAIEAYYAADPEHARLEHAVIEAVMKWRKLKRAGYLDSAPLVRRTWQDMEDAGDALLEFEQKQK